MELTYQRTMLLPAQYTAIAEEELSYLDGGEYTFSVGKYNVTFHPEVLGQYALNFCVNAAYLIGAAATSAAITGVVKGYKDGLSIGQTINHFWGRQNTAGRVASVAVGAFAGYYVYQQAIQLYELAVGLVDTAKEWYASWKNGGTEAAAAA